WRQRAQGWRVDVPPNPATCRVDPDGLGRTGDGAAVLLVTDGVIANELDLEGVALDRVRCTVQRLGVDLAATVGDRLRDGGAHVGAVDAADVVVVGSTQKRRSFVIEQFLDRGGQTGSGESERSRFSPRVLDDLSEFAKFLDIGSLDLVDGQDESAAAGCKGVG